MSFSSRIRIPHCTIWQSPGAQGVLNQGWRKNPWVSWCERGDHKEEFSSYKEDKIGKDLNEN